MRVWTLVPSGPVCLVRSGCLSISSATRRASSRLPTGLTPPSPPFSLPAGSPLPSSSPWPRPPAWTWALTTTHPPPESWSNALSASSGVRTTTCLGTFAPAAASRSLAWYSWIFMGHPGGCGGRDAACYSGPVDRWEGARDDGERSGFGRRGEGREESPPVATGGLWTGGLRGRHHGTAHRPVVVPRHHPHLRRLALRRPAGLPHPPPPRARRGGLQEPAAPGQVCRQGGPQPEVVEAAAGGAGPGVAQDRWRGGPGPAAGTRRDAPVYQHERAARPLPRQDPAAAPPEVDRAGQEARLARRPRLRLGGGDV